jgi:hypothetical protein
VLIVVNWTLISEGQSCSWMNAFADIHNATLAHLDGLTFLQDVRLFSLYWNISILLKKKFKIKILLRTACAITTSFISFARRYSLL